MILYTLDINPSGHNRQAGKTAKVYLGVSAFCIVFNQIYALFAHGVASPFMSLLFLYPLLGGAVPFFLLWRFVPRADQVRDYRAVYNCYNSGIATLGAGSMLRGIFEIAGTASPYSIVFSVCGWTLFFIGLVFYWINFFRLSQAN